MPTTLIASTILTITGGVLIVVADAHARRGRSRTAIRLTISATALWTISLAITLWDLYTL